MDVYPSHLQQLQPLPSDSAAVLLEKQLQLLLCLQVYEAWECRAGSAAQLQQAKAQPQHQSQVHTDGSPEVQPSPQVLPQQHQQHQHGAPHLRQLLGTESTEDPGAADMQQHDDEDGLKLQPAQLHPMQHAGPGSMMPPPPAAQLPTSNKDLLAQLLMPAGAGGGTTAHGAAGAQPRWQQPHKACQGRQRRLQQGRRSLLGVQGNSLPAGAAAAASHQLQEGHLPGEESPGPLQQQMLLNMRAHYLLDAQSQAPGAAGVALSGPADLQRPALPPAQQQLFSPRTATHAPLQDAAAGSGGSCMHGSTGHVCAAALHHGEDASPLNHPHQAQQQHGMAGQPEQPEEIEVTPAQPRAGSLAGAYQHAAAHQESGSGAAASAARPIPAAAGGPGHLTRAVPGLALLQSVAATPDALEPQAAATAAASGGAAATHTPAAVHTELLAAAGSRRAAAAAGLAAALFHTPAAAGRGAARGVFSQPAAAAADAGGPQIAAGWDCVSGSSLLGATPPSTSQHMSASAGRTPVEQGPTATQPRAAAALAFEGEGAASFASGGELLLRSLPNVSAGTGADPAVATVSAGVSVGVSAGPGYVAGTPLPDETQPPSQQLLQESDTLLGAVGQAGQPSHVPATPASDVCSAGDGGEGAQQRGSSSRKHKPDDSFMQIPYPSAAAGLAALQYPHQVHKRQRVSDPQDACRPHPGFAALAPTAEDGPDTKKAGVQGSHAGIASSSSSKAGGRTIYLDKVQQRVVELHLGQQVTHILCCSGYAAVLLQEPGSNTHRLLLLNTPMLLQQPLPGSHMPRHPQQQQQQGPVAVTATRLPVLVGPTKVPNTPVAGRGAPIQQQHSKAHADLLRTGLLLLPPTQHVASGGAGQQQGPLLAVASELQLQGAGLSNTGDGHTPVGRSTAPKHTPAQAAKLAAATGSSKRKLQDLRSAAADAFPQRCVSTPGVSPQGGNGCSSHAVSIYQLDCSAEEPPAAVAGGQQQAQHPGGVVLVQALPAGFAVRCLAACEQQGLLAAAGDGGRACVWPLMQQQGAEAGPTATAEGLSKRQVADASACVALPSASYMNIPFPDIAEVCFVVQGTANDIPVHHGGQHEQLQQQECAPDHVSGGPGLSGSRVLLVGCCSQGPVAVWDVGLRQQIMAIHHPGLRLSGLLAPGLNAAGAAAAAAAMQVATAVAGRSAAEAARGMQQQLGSTEQPRPVVCLGMVSQLESSGRDAARDNQKQLRAVVLHSSGDAQIGRPLVAAGAGGVSTAVLCGTTAAAVASSGVLQAWDVVSGMRHLSMRPRGSCSGAGTSTVALLPLAGCRGTVGGCDGGGPEAANGSPPGNCGGGMLALAGSLSGALVVSLL